MTAQKLIRSSLVAALILGAPAVAFARRPPALAEAQTQTQSVTDSCPDTAVGTAGYRDMLTRAVALAPGAASQLASARRPVLHLATGDVVIRCAKGDVQAGSGYRDMTKRFAREEAPVVTAATECVKSGF